MAWSDPQFAEQGGASGVNHQGAKRVLTGMGHDTGQRLVRRGGEVLVNECLHGVLSVVDCVDVVFAIAPSEGHAVWVKPVNGFDGSAVGVVCAVVEWHGAGASCSDALDGDGRAL